jgi:hypothetical protein
VTQSWDEFHAKEKWEDGSKRTVQSYCKVCQLQRQRELNGSQPRQPADLDARREQKRQWYAKNKAKILAQKRARYAELKKDPHWMRRKRENDRLSAWSYRRRKGIPEREYKNERATVVQLESSRINAEPFAQWLEALSHEVEGTQELAFRTGLLERTIRRILTREFKSVSMDLIDRALLNEGSTCLWELYPSLYEDMGDSQAA